ncbi:MAG TPA: SDR family oxidoreductase [Deltaproteobacteria bacterium]|nr:SDR family oxidoreductase [Deltaproteobacteria bacterium]
MKNLANKTAAVTGAASGIGRMLAVNLADEGCNLAIADIDEAGLEETAARIGARVNVSTHIVDVSKREEVVLFAEEASRHHGGVDIIINNAGVALGDFLETVPIEDFEWLMGINFWGVVHGTMAFLPYLRKRPEGHIVNISSINGIIPNPNNGPYCAAKFAVKGYTETLAQEMHGTSIHVSCVHPGGIKTNIARNTRFNCAMYALSREKAICLYEDELFRTTADEAARVIISGIKRNKRRILIGIDAKVLDLITRFFPVTAVTLSTLFTRFMARTYARKELKGEGT